ncbi:MAG: LysM domain-containing protein [Chloroflexi bacterium]|nr:LysM domain-containing protein [Chloroflexota bacterium]
MKARPCCLFLTIGLLLLGGLIGLTLLGVQFLRQRQERARWEYLPPVARITEPQSGFSAPVGSYLSAVSTITFSPQSPVQTIEWYLNGIRVESHPLQPGAGVSRAYDSYDLLIPTEGTHVLMARAINARGAIGLSQPLTFQGVAKGEAFYAVTVNEGETLESLAAGYGSDAATLQTLNPGLGNAPPPGTTVKVPIPPENEPPSPLPTPPTASSGVTLIAAPPMLKVADIPSNFYPLLTVTPPQVPTNLQGEVSNCRVKLLWEDNANNESGYEVWMAAPGAPLTRLVTLRPASGGVTWFEFQAPGPGYSLFWVEAVNAIGQQGSNIIYLNVDAGCPAGAATHLQVQILDIAVSASAGRVYCYASFENSPELRLPAQDGDFIAVQGGHGDLTSWPHTFALPIPQDGTLDLSGECWGWAGQNLSKLGKFTTALGSETWDGAPRLAQGSAIEISLAVHPQTPAGTKMIFAERSPGLPSGSYPGFLEETLPIDPTLPIPVITTMVESTNYPLLTANCNPRCQSLIWKWDGNETKIRGFAVFLDGLPYAGVFPYPPMRSVFVQPPISACSAESRWQVAAVTASAMSQLSTPYILPGPHPLPQNPDYLGGTCTIYVKVKFEYLDLEWTHDGFGSGSPGDCDTMDAYYAIHVDERGPATAGSYLYQTRKFYGGGIYRPLSCGNHSSLHLFDKVNPALVSGVQTTNNLPFSEILLFGELERMDQPLLILVAANFLDYDPSSDPDWIAKYGTEYAADNFQAAIDFFGCGRTFVDEDEMDSGKSRLQYTITVYPNACDRLPEILP